MDRKACPRAADREASPIRGGAEDAKGATTSTPPRKLLRHVKQAVAVAIASPMRKVRRTRRDGSAATKLLGDEHGSVWDLMGWMNGVLGKSDITKKTAKSPHRRLSRWVWEWVGERSTVLVLCCTVYSTGYGI